MAAILYNSKAISFERVKLFFKPITPTDIWKTLQNFNIFRYFQNQNVVQSELKNQAKLIIQSQFFRKCVAKGPLNKVYLRTALIRCGFDGVGRGIVSRVQLLSFRQKRPNTWINFNEISYTDPWCKISIEVGNAQNHFLSFHNGGYLKYSKKENKNVGYCSYFYMSMPIRKL